MLNRLGLVPTTPQADIELVNAAFRALSEGGDILRWEPFFFDWFGGIASEERAPKGPALSLSMAANISRPSVPCSFAARCSAGAPGAHLLHPS